MNLTKILVGEIIIVFIIGIIAGYLGSYLENTRFSKLLNLNQLASLRSPIIEQKKVIIQENQALTQAIRKVQSDIVPIFQFKNNTQEAIANCFPLTRDGLVVTLSTCLPSKSLSQIFIGKKTMSFQILKKDSLNNLVLVKIKGDGFQTSEFAKKEETMLGEEIFVLSSISFFSTTSSSSLNYIVDQGIISQIKVSSYLTNISSGNNLDGSPCFNDEGEFIGLAENQKNGHLIIIPAYIIKSFAGL